MDSPFLIHALKVRGEMSTHAHTHLEARALVVRRAESLREATLGAEMTVWEAVMACMIVSVFGFFLSLCVRKGG